MVARANKAKADMDSDNARLDKSALLKRGVLRGARKQFAMLPMNDVELYGYGWVMRAILALTRYKRARQNPRKSSKSAHSSWAVLVGVAPNLGIEKA